MADIQARSKHVVRLRHGQLGQDLWQIIVRASADAPGCPLRYPMGIR